MISKIDQYVIDRVREKRIEMNISQSELADCINLTKGFIGNIENPKLNYKYNLTHINEIAKVLQCSPKDFLPEYPLY